MKIPKEHIKSPTVLYKVFSLKNGDDMPLNEETELMSLSLEGAIIEYLRNGGITEAMEKFETTFAEFFANVKARDEKKFQVLMVHIDKSIIKAQYADDGMVDGTDSDLVVLHLNEHPYEINVMDISPIDFELKKDPGTDRWILLKASVKIPQNTSAEMDGYKKGTLNMKGAWIM